MDGSDLSFDSDLRHVKCGIAKRQFGSGVGNHDNGGSRYDYFYHGGEDPTWSSYNPVLSGGSLRGGLTDRTIGVAKHEIKYYLRISNAYGSRTAQTKK